MNPSYQDLTEVVPVRSAGGMGAELHKWARDGVLVLPKVLPDELIDRYCALREQVGPGGWGYEVPYMHYRELRDLCLYRPVIAKMAELVGEPVGLHLNLTGWVSTERDWHSDSYLNPEGVDDWYVAAWFALDDIHPDSGPFQYVPGSHRWPVLRRQRIFDRLTTAERSDPAWPSFTEPWVARACAGEIEARGAEVVTYLPKRGDVLLWHAFLVHRGSRPNVPGMQRKACIAHYSGIHHRPDMRFFTDGDPVYGREDQLGPPPRYYAFFDRALPLGYPPATI